MEKLGKYEKIKECPELGYFIGAIMGDGYAFLKHAKCRTPQRGICLGVRDKDFSDYYGKKVVFKITSSLPPQEYHEYETTTPNRKKYWGGSFIIQFPSKTLYDLIKDKKRCLKYIKKYSIAFLQGIFDAEGGCRIVKGKYIRVYFGSKDKKLIDLVSSLLKENKIEHTSKKRMSDGIWRFKIRASSTKLFQQKIDFRINRKHQRLIGNKEYFPSDVYHRKIILKGSVEEKHKKWAREYLKNKISGDKLK